MKTTARARYSDYRLHQARPDQPALKRHLNLFIYPAVSLYITLQAEDWDQKAALETAERVTLLSLLPAMSLFTLLGRLPLFFTLIRWMTPWGMRNTFPDPAWKTEWVEANENVIAFNFHTCFYQGTLKRLGAAELTPLFCKMDRLFYVDVSLYLRFERLETLALTGKPCNFRFHHLGEE